MGIKKPLNKWIAIAVIAVIHWSITMTLIILLYLEHPTSPYEGKLVAETPSEQFKLLTIHILLFH